MPTRRTAHASHAMGSVRSMTVPVHVVYTGVGYRYQVTSKELASLLYSKSSLRGECIFILARSHFECENLNEEARILTFGLLSNVAASSERQRKAVSQALHSALADQNPPLPFPPSHLVSAVMRMSSTMSLTGTLAPAALALSLAATSSVTRICCLRGPEDFRAGPLAAVFSLCVAGDGCEV